MKIRAIVNYVQGEDVHAGVIYKLEEPLVIDSELADFVLFGDVEIDGVPFLAGSHRLQAMQSLCFTQGNGSGAVMFRTDHTPRVFEPGPELPEVEEIDNPIEEQFRAWAVKMGIPMREYVYSAEQESDEDDWDGEEEDYDDLPPSDRDWETAPLSG